MINEKVSNVMQCYVDRAEIETIKDALDLLEAEILCNISYHESDNEKAIELLKESLCHHLKMQFSDMLKELR